MEAALTAIGNELSLSIKTVSSYRKRILQKPDMKSNAELVRYAVEHRLIL
jgi:DNA-binding CsgD family transcriptional regulator